MTLPSSGLITLRQIQTEFSAPAGTRLRQLYRGGTYVPAGASALIPTSGVIKLTDFYGASNLAPPGSQSFTVPGTYTFTVPLGYSILNVTTVGGGGGGGGWLGSSDSHQGGIGGSGGYRTTNIFVTSGQVLTIVVGAGGLPGNSSGISCPGPFNGGDYVGGLGGDSYISGFSGTVSSGGYGGLRSGPDDKGTIESWTNFYLYNMLYYYGNGRGGKPNGRDQATVVSQLRNTGRSGLTTPTNYTYGLGAGTGGEGVSGLYPPFCTQKGGDGAVTVRWGNSVPSTFDSYPIKGLTFPAIGTYYTTTQSGTIDTPTNITFSSTFSVSVYGGLSGVLSYLWTCPPQGGFTFSLSNPTGTSTNLTINNFLGSTFTGNIYCTITATSGESVTLSSQLDIQIDVTPQGGNNGNDN